MDLLNFKAKGTVGMGAVWAMLQGNPDKVFGIWFVRSTVGEHEPKGAIVFRQVRYGAPPVESVVAAARVRVGGGEGGSRNSSKHDAAGTIPVHYEGTSQYRSILVSHILVFDGYLVSL